MTKKSNDLKVNIICSEPNLDDTDIEEKDYNPVAQFFDILIEIDNTQKAKMLDTSEVKCIKCDCEIKDFEEFSATSIKPMCRSCAIKHIEEKRLLEE